MRNKKVSRAYFSRQNRKKNTRGEWGSLAFVFHNIRTPYPKAEKKYPEILFQTKPQRRRNDRERGLIYLMEMFPSSHSSDGRKHKLVTRRVSGWVSAGSQSTRPLYGWHITRTWTNKREYPIIDI